MAYALSAAYRPQSATTFIAVISSAIKQLICRHMRWNRTSEKHYNAINKWVMETASLRLTPRCILQRYP
jgi:hypothetical protein